MNHVAQDAPPSTAAADRPLSERLWHPRPHLCPVCTSRAQGFGWFDPRVPRARRQHRWFCAMSCQGLFAHKAMKGMMMPDITEEETQALPAVMRALGSEMERIGWDRPLAQLTRNDMHRLIVVTVEAFRAEMAQIAANSEIPF
jgi:hypothetical protein